ncbi:hypothetical protein B0T17DRAFT_493240 [Bombardia bombarda]|uniref:DUF8021 domain-containing protein n=1 Tax=Bombardia bombarda TaxID=252184 RepID=A0AA40C4X7_9PEZI|nr:hypothetical protein B0T17DRAFT_493240 [Bombardia bombarda]
MPSLNAILLTILPLATLTTLTSAECTRAALKAATAQYVAAASAGNPALWTALSPNASYIENDEPVPVARGVLANPMKLDHNRSFHDTTACAALTELIVTDTAKPYVVHTRMLFDPALDAARIKTVESTVATTGDWAFNATGYLYWNSLESWAPIPEGQRDSRDTIKAAGDAYFDRWNDTRVEIPLGTPCARLEGGAYTGLGRLEENTCNLGGFPSNIVVTNRRYIVDEEMGVVDIFIGFPGLDRNVPTRPAPDSHLFRVQGGKVRYIHTVSHCFTTRCGMTGPVPGSGNVGGGGERGCRRGLGV